MTVVDDSGTTFVFEPFAYISNIPKTYLLTGMSDVSGHSITFTYTKVNTYAIPAMNEYYSTGNPPPGEYLSRDFTYGVNTSCYLNTIGTQTEEVTFTLGSREDLYPGTTGRLTNMKVTSKLDGKTVCQYRFDHGYFEAPQNAPGGNYLSATECKLPNDIPEEVLRKRLKLLSVTRMNGTNAGDKHSFAYNEEKQLPYKTSFAQDYWGYYNGEENYSTLTGYMHTLIPPLKGSEEDGDPQFVTAIRNSSRENITACILKKITYPTGGTAEFEFEPHTLGTGGSLVST